MIISTTSAACGGWTAGARGEEQASSTHLVTHHWAHLELTSYQISTIWPDAKQIWTRAHLLIIELCGYSRVTSSNKNHQHVLWCYWLLQLLALSLSPSYLVANIYRERALILASNDGILFNVLILLAGCWPRTEMKLLWLLATALRCARSSQQWRSSFCPTTCVANVPAFP